MDTLTQFRLEMLSKLILGKARDYIDEHYGSVDFNVFKARQTIRKDILSNLCYEVDSNVLDDMIRVAISIAIAELKAELNGEDVYIDTM